jgi:undecaprenyl-diphosphatase
MTILQAIIYGIIQGAGEFLPISSTAHLVLAPYFFGWKDPGLSFDVALHLGTLIAVVIFFFWDWVEIIKIGIFRKQSDEGKYSKNIFWFLVVATIPGMIAGILFEQKAETSFRNPLLIAFTLAIVGFILYMADKKLKAKKDLNSIGWKDSIIIGLSQALSIIPGVSRSGSTITSGLFLGLDRKSAARFSFLLSTPIIFGAAALKLPHLFSGGINMNLVVAILVSALSGFLAIKYLLKFIEKTSYKIFFWYRLALASVVLIFFFLNK